MTEFRVEWSHAALEDFVQIIDFIAQDQPANAERVADRIDNAAQKLCRQPRRGRQIPEMVHLQSTVDLRETLVDPWRLMYRIDPGQVTIIALVDSRRNIDLWLARSISRFDIGN